MMDTRISSRLFMLAFCRILIQVSRTVGNHLKTFNELLFLKHLQRAKSGVYLEFPVIKRRVFNCRLVNTNDRSIYGLTATGFFMQDVFKKSRMKENIISSI